MVSNKIVKSVSFNRTNEEDMLLLEFLEGKVFSGYVKELIMKDIRMSRVRNNGGIRIRVV